MKKIIFIISLTIFSLSFSETKIGYIDSQIIMSEFEDVRQVQVELEKEQKKLQTQYEKKLISLDSLKTAYQTGSIILSEQKKIQICLPQKLETAKISIGKHLFFDHISTKLTKCWRANNLSFFVTSIKSVPGSPG